MPFKFLWSTCLLALVISAAPAGAQSSLVRPQGTHTVTLPDGTLMSGTTNQVLVFLRSGATGSDEAAIRSAIPAAGGQIVGELTTLRMLQVQMADTTRTGALMVRVGSLNGVQHVGVNLYLTSAAIVCRADGDAYVPANHVPPSPDSAGDVVMIVVDEFRDARSNVPPADPRHGDLVAAVAIDAGGVNAAGRNIFELGRNVIKIEDSGPIDDFAHTAWLVEQEVLRHPGKKIVINYSGGPSQCDDELPALDSRNEAERANARASCAAADRQFYSAFNNGLMPRLRTMTNDNVVWVNAAANVNVSLENAQSISSCDYIPVGGMDGSQLAQFTEVSAAIPVYQHACHVSPRSLPGFEADGNSLAAPFVAGQLAANWARNPRLNGCTLGNTVRNLPPMGPGETGAVFDPVMVAAAAASPLPGIPTIPLPVGTLTCGAVTISPALVTGTVNQTVQLTATAAAGGGTFEFQSSNPEVANVNRATGAVTIRRTGVATISAKRPGSTCSGEATVVAPAETYRGTFTLQMTISMPQAGWTPNPLIITGSTPGAPMVLAVGPSLSTAGVFTAAMTTGPGSVSVTIPSSTCTSCDPQFTIPGMTQNDAMPTSSGNLVGESDQRLLRIPIPGLPAMTGTVSVLASTAQVTLNWNYQTAIAGANVSMSLNANLTRQ